jgi:hypothetical protein
MGLASKYPILTGCLLIPVVIVTGLILFLTPAAYQNYRGVCRVEGRVLTDEEKIRRVVEQVNADKDVYYDDIYERRSYFVTPIPYPSVDGFLASNPDCCKLLPRKKVRGLLDVLTGDNANEVIVRYQVRFHNNEGNLTGGQATDSTVIDNCGEFTYR